MDLRILSLALFALFALIRLPAHGSCLISDAHCIYECISSPYKCLPFLTTIVHIFRFLIFINQLSIKSDPAILRFIVHFDYLRIFFAYRSNSQASYLFSGVAKNKIWA